MTVLSWLFASFSHSKFGANFSMFPSISGCFHTYWVLVFAFTVSKRTPHHSKIEWGDQVPLT